LFRTSFRLSSGTAAIIISEESAKSESRDHEALHEEASALLLFSVLETIF
jgi:hypothetical protein